jgi:cytochrome c peroxidase
MKQLPRRTPTLLNLAWAEQFFWDGRASSLEEQALGPITSPGEMNLPLDRLVATVCSVPEYQALFQKAFPGEPISAPNIAKALATYERGLVSAKAPFDRWIEGDSKAISEEAVQGFLLFNTKANCAKCHSGWRFTDDSFHDVGMKSADRGRGALQPDLEVCQFAFKTPTLRNATRRAPYMHDGSLRTLDEVIELYNAGGQAKRPSLSQEVRPLGLTPAERRALLEFLTTLTSQDPPSFVPDLPR